jgi:hypothetical protein
MKGERKLRLVKGGPPPPLRDGADPRSPGPADEEPPFTAEEIAAAAVLRESIDREPLFVDLKAAHLPGPLAADDLDAILARAMGDDAATTAAERAAAERLRAELDGEAPESDASELLIALKLAAHPTDLPPARHQALIDAAFARLPFFGRRGPQTPAVRRIAPVTMAALASVAAMAASIALYVGRVPAGHPSATATLVRARSADDLFDPATPFPRRGEESARVDRIASARAADLRQNRFAAWGVK